MLADENKKYILAEYLWIIHGISDKEYQRRVWIRGEGPECDSFDETCCGFFDDYNYVFENYKDYWITDVQYQVLEKLWVKFRAFSRKHDWPPDFIDTPEWDKVTLLAKEVLQAFSYTTTYMLTHKVRQHRLRNLLKMIDIISDRDYQQRVWIDEDPTGTDFNETCNRFFDYGDRVLEHYKDYLITDIQYQALKKFWDKFSTFINENNCPCEFIDTSEWKEIMELAKEVLRASDYRVS